MNVIVAVEFEVPGWDGSKKAAKGGHPFRRHIKKEDRGARVAQALTSIETIAGVLGVDIAAAMFPGTTFTEPSEVGTSGIASCGYPVLYEAPNAIDDDKQLDDDRDDRAFFHVPRVGKPPATLHWLQRVTSGQQTRTIGETPHESVSAFLDEVGQRKVTSTVGGLLPIICGEIAVVPQHRPNSTDRHVCDWPKLQPNQGTVLANFMSVWKDARVILNPFHTRMAWYSDLRRAALSRRDKLVIAIGNSAAGSSATTLRVFVDGEGTWQQRHEVDITKLDAAAAPQSRGAILGVWEGPAGKRNRYWFIAAG